MISFACFCPHPPILLESVGSSEDRKILKKTIDSLKFLKQKLEKENPDCLLISSPHLDWGFDVPLSFLAPNFKGEIKRELTDYNKSPAFYFKKGQKICEELEANKKYALIASGDMSHCLKENGPYGFHPQGPQFDKALMECLEKKDIETFLKLNDNFPQAGECGLRSFCFVLGILEQSKIKAQPRILSYQCPFGVGYLTADFMLSAGPFK